MTVWKDYASRITDTFSAAETALIVVDVQASFCSPTGTTARKHANTHMQALPAKINAFANYFRSLGGLTVYLKAVADDESSSPADKWLNALKGNPRPATKNDAQQNLYGLELPDDALVLEKRSYGFAHTSLKSTLEGHGIKTVLVCGVRTEICVRRCAERAAAEGFLVFVLEDLCATKDANGGHADQAPMFLNAYTGVVLTTDRMKELLLPAVTA